ncbi:TIGR02587 family membrane protein [Pseudomonas sp. ODNR1LW]|nr:TIGR02587 family membrane protein [Pseudomonas sp. ODNR1LW]
MGFAHLFDPSIERRYLKDLGRAFAGALLFTIPLLMTMEMWEAGVAMEPQRLLLFICAGLPLLYGLAYYAGFSHRRGFRNDLLDTTVAMAVGVFTASALLALFGVVHWDDPPRQTLGMVMLQAVPAAMGALLARRQLSDDKPEAEEGQASYAGELFLMTAGALFFALNVAPTEEMILIAYKTTALHAVGLIALSVLLLHLIVFKAGFAGQEEAEHPAEAFFHFTLPGYAIALGVSLLVLFIFGRTEGHAFGGVLHTMIVLGFPASIGAAAARLLV